MRRSFNKSLKSFILIISLLAFAGCERTDLNTWTYLYTWSYSIRYKDLIEKTECFHKKIVEDRTDYSCKSIQYTPLVSKSFDEVLALGLPLKGNDEVLELLKAPSLYEEETLYGEIYPVNSEFKCLLYE